MGVLSVTDTGDGIGAVLRLDVLAALHRPHWPAVVCLKLVVTAGMLAGWPGGL